MRWIEWKWKYIWSNMLLAGWWWAIVSTYPTIYQMTLYFSDFVILKMSLQWRCWGFLANWCSCSFFFVGYEPNITRPGCSWRLKINDFALLNLVVPGYQISFVITMQWWRLLRCKLVLWFFWFFVVFCSFSFFVVVLGHQIPLPCQGWWRLLCKLVFYWCCFL